MSDAPHSLLPADVHEPHIGLKPHRGRARPFFRAGAGCPAADQQPSHPPPLLYAPSGWADLPAAGVGHPRAARRRGPGGSLRQWNTPTRVMVAGPWPGGPVAVGQGQLARRAGPGEGRIATRCWCWISSRNICNATRAIWAICRRPGRLAAQQPRPARGAVFREGLASVDATCAGHVLSPFGLHHHRNTWTGSAPGGYRGPARRTGANAKRPWDRLLDDLAPATREVRRPPSSGRH